jgi:hypothetical protein
LLLKFIREKLFYMAETDRNHPALIGGLIVGILSTLPVVNVGNLIFCMWALLGGAVAVRLYIQKSPKRVTHAEATRVAGLAGVIGAVIRVFIGMPIDLATLPAGMRWLEGLAADPNMKPVQQQQIKEALATLQGMTTGEIVLNFLLPAALIGATVLFGFTLLGGALGVTLFEKRRDDFGEDS